MDKSERGAGDSRGPQSGQLKLMSREGGKEMRGREKLSRESAAGPLAFGAAGFHPGNEMTYLSPVPFELGTHKHTRVQSEKHISPTHLSQMHTNLYRLAVIVIIIATICLFWLCVCVHSVCPCWRNHAATFSVTLSQPTFIHHCHHHQYWTGALLRAIKQKHPVTSSNRDFSL